MQLCNFSAALSIYKVKTNIYLQIYIYKFMENYKNEKKMKISIKKRVSGNSGINKLTNKGERSMIKYTILYYYTHFRVKIQNPR